MSSTIRPQNQCLSCEYTWYPRGKNLSHRCPRCKSHLVEFVPMSFVEKTFFFGLFGTIMYPLLEGFFFSPRVQSAAGKLIEFFFEFAPKLSEKINLSGVEPHQIVHFYYSVFQEFPVIFCICWFLPVGIGILKNHHHLTSITVLTVFTSWTLFGWGLALAIVLFSKKKITREIVVSARLEPVHHDRPRIPQRSQRSSVRRRI